MRLNRIYIITLISACFFGLSNLTLAQTFNKKALEGFAKERLKKEKASKEDSLKILPIIYEAANLGAATSVNNDQIWSGGITGLSLSGSGIVMGYWDENQPRLTHQEYIGRVTFEDSESGANNNHATQMVGTMIGTGIQADARGMANQANVEGYNWNNDIAEMATEAANGLTLSSHPYIETAGWTTNTSICDPNSDYPEIDWMWFSLETENTTKAYQLGYYDFQAQNWDSASYLAPNYLMVKAAGNQRKEGPSTQPIKHWKYDSGIQCVQDSTTVRELDGGVEGFESINAASVGKNVLVVGAVESSFDNFDDLESITTISSSGFGPTDDGRIKPDIVAPTGVYTSSFSSNTSYATSGGTSAATAVVTGSIALLREHYQNLNTDTLSSASLRALVAQTSDDVGNMGPDYKTGWGVLNTERAARFISSNHADKSSSILKDTVLYQGSTIDIDFEHTSSRPIILTIAWTDPPGTVPINGDDPADIILVNDLDVSISDPNAVIYQPWVLDPSNPNNAATKGDNDVDNIEQIVISEAMPGTYSISISHEGSLRSGSQRVAILMSEAEPEIKIETIAAGNWKNSSTWLGGVVPSNTLHRARLKHAVTLDTTASLRGVSFEGVSSELQLNREILNLYGGVYYSSGGVGFSGDTSSTLSIYGWDKDSDALKFKVDSEKLKSLSIDTNGDSIKLDGTLKIYSNVSLQNGVFDVSSGGLTLISDSLHTARLEKASGRLTGDFTYSRMFTSKNSGWRIISSPVQHERFSTLSDSFHTQGGVWADFIVSENESNLWIFDSSSQDFVGQVGADSSFTSGEGYLFYIFEDAPGGTPFPTALELTGSEPDSISVGLFRGAHDSLSYSLVGNPFAGVLDWHEIVSDGTNLGTSYAIWDPEGLTEGGSAGFKYYNSVNQLGDAGRYISPMQGFFVQSTSENSELIFEQDQKVNALPNKYGKAISQETQFIRFKLLDAKGNLLDEQAHLTFSETSHSGLDLADVLRLRSLDGIGNQISFIDSNKNRKVFEGRSSKIKFDEIDINIQTEVKGSYKLNWEKRNGIPEEWELELIDVVSQNRINMKTEMGYIFDTGDKQSGVEARFKVLINRGGLGDSETPTRFEMSQNYPNPFNPTTTISYSLKSTGMVRIEVFNTLGQKVAVLVDEQQSAGKHVVQFNASQLSSGVYYYRIESGSFNQIRSMVLIK